MGNENIPDKYLYSQDKQHATEKYTYMQWGKQGNKVKMKYICWKQILILMAYIYFLLCENH